MDKLFSLFFLCLIGNSFSLLAQSLTGQELLNKSIDYHDPKGMWDKLSTEWTFTETRPDGSESNTLIVLDNAKSVFTMKTEKDGNRISQKVATDDCSFVVNGNPPDTAQIRKYRLNCKRGKLLRNYYTYLWGLPMKLRDAGTIIHDEVTATTFQGTACYVLKVSYEKSVGKDTWYFYMDKTDYHLIGYRFYHIESENDGEYITLEGEVETNKMRIPKTRKWYYNKDDKFLGADILNDK